VLKIGGITTFEEMKKGQGKRLPVIKFRGTYEKAYIFRFFSDIARLRIVVGISAAIANSTESV